MPTAFTIGIIQITSGVVSTILAILGWILLDEIRHEYLLISTALPTIAMFLCGMCAIGFVRKSLHSLLIGIIFFATICVASEIFSIASHSYIIYIFSRRNSKVVELAVASISLILSCIFGVFNGYVIIKFARYLVTVNASFEGDATQSNNQQSGMASTTTPVDAHFLFFGLFGPGLFQLVSGGVTLVLGIVSLVVLQGGFAPATCYLGSITTWSLITSKWACLWSFALIVSSTLYLVFNIIGRRIFAAYIAFYVLVMIAGLLNLVGSAIITFKMASLEEVPVFKLTLFNRLRMPITSQNITFGITLCCFGFLFIIVTFIEPFVGIPTHLLYTFATGCQLILAGQLGNNLAFKYSEDLVASYFIINFMASAFITTYLGLLIAECTSLPFILTQRPASIAMAIVNFVLIAPALIISLYETVITGYRSGICICGDRPAVAMIENTYDASEQAQETNSPIDNLNHTFAIQDDTKHSIQDISGETQI
ncbi:uncharacterized protein TRIADDRAFT_62622 [Trichoplax adhaerens]|uniref:Uncharacterized protein n=1 Tax=Trichoplax adhaerens TaxID=10228 RepID=B3SEC7_TRIAD|nr:predicted protein [Trichoplax adhaerens]EDV18918.1 predicted protein [Trichoplax adhaerens]|eukprot:XP_002118596.1 predicted protein [Trichoplax adhaerens]